jgi:hypothetical protein
MRHLSTILVVLALTLAGIGVYFALSPPAGRPAFNIDQAERDLGEFPVGESVITFRITNSSNQPARIVGTAFG